MAIVKMSRFSLMAFQSEKDALLQALQAMEEVSFTDLPAQMEDEELSETIGKDVATLAEAEVSDKLALLDRHIQLLEEFAPKKSLKEKLNSALPVISYEEAQEKVASMDLTSLEERITSLDKEFRQCDEALEDMRQERRRLLPYVNLDFPLNLVSQMKSVQVKIGALPRRWLENLRNELLDCEMSQMAVLSTDEKNASVSLLIENSERAVVEDCLRQNAFVEENLPQDKAINELMEEGRKKQLRLEVQKKYIAAQLEALSLEHLDEIKLKYEVLNNDSLRVQSRKNLLAGKHVFMMEGYLPTKRQADFEALLRNTLDLPYELDVYEVKRDDERIDEVPILLENKSYIKPFEDVVSTYAMPQYSEVDPTPLLFPWYMITFGMMMGDLGYGLLIWLLTFIGLKFFKLKEGTRNQMRFYHVLSYPTILAGIIFGSFFALDTKDVFGFSGLISPGEDTMQMLGISLGLGLVMLLSGLLVKAYMMLRDGDPLGAFYDVGLWLMAVLGGLVLLAGSSFGLSDQAVNIGKWVMIAGMVGIVIFSARDEKSKVGRYAWGLYNLYGISSWVGDIVSYSRILALAMSGGYIGAAVNMIAGMVGGKGALGIPFAIIVLVVFHAFNVFLSGLSAYVHSLRLVYVEFFGKFYEGGGKAFKSFRAEKKYMDIQ